MTIKQIADLANVGKATVQDWIKKMNENRSSILKKNTEALKSKKAADFTQMETLEIVRAGGNETLASLLEENATRGPVSLNEHLSKGTVRGMILEVVFEAVKAALELVSPPQPAAQVALPARIDYYSIKGYLSLTGRSGGDKEAMLLWRACKAESERQGKEIRDIPDANYGTIKAYHMDVLHAVIGD